MKEMMVINRILVVVMISISAMIALNVESIMDAVIIATVIGTTSYFFPIIGGLYWKRANNQGAMFAIIAGVSSWLLLEIFNADGLWPPQLAGLLMSALGMLAGSLLPDLTRRRH